MLGGCYAIPRKLLAEVGGWIRLPGYAGSQEEAMSFLLLRQNVPIYVHLGASVQHEFRRRPPRVQPWDGFLANIVAGYFLTFSEDTYLKLWKPVLRGGTILSWDQREVRLNIPDSVFALVETDEMRAYRDGLRARFRVSDEEFLGKKWVVE
jgi:hypothetical protein